MNKKRMIGLGLLVCVMILGYFLLGFVTREQRDTLEQTTQQTADETETVRQNDLGVRRAMFYVNLPDQAVQCTLCFRNCIIRQGMRGLCRVRENRQGELYTLVFGLPSAVHIDPIEKEPQYHHWPGEYILAVGTVGCNFLCLHCHNWSLSQASPGERAVFDLPPSEVVNLAIENDVNIISFTYNDPIVCFEYLYYVAKLAQESGLRVIWHTNGAINHEPLMAILPYTDAITVDLKGFTDFAYANSAAVLQPVLDSLKTIRESGVWLEIVNLVIPTINDNPSEIRLMSRWIVENIGRDVPLHFSRFFPNYRLTDVIPTPIETLEKAREIAIEEGVRFSTIGNVAGHRYNSTFCPDCDLRLIYRIHFQVMYNKISDGKCPGCDAQIPGLWQ